MDGDHSARRPHRPVAPAVVLAAAALLAIGLLAEGAAAQSGVLVGNTGKANVNGLTIADEASGKALAQALRTGPDESGYLLESVVLDFVTPSLDPGQLFDEVVSTNYAVTVREDRSGDPGPAVLYRLANPAMTAGGLNEFAAPPNARLRANATYHVVAVGPANLEGPGWWRTPSGSGLDSGTAAGWDIVAAHRQGGGSAWSVGTDSLQMQVKGSALGAPDAPTGLTAEAVSPTQVDLSWEEPTTGGFVTGYEVEFSTAAGGPWTPPGVPGGTTFSHLGRASPATYHYRVRATNAAGAGDWAAASATTIARDADGEGVWSATVTLGVNEQGSGETTYRTYAYGEFPNQIGSLSEAADFVYEETTYTLESLGLLTILEEGVVTGDFLTLQTTPRLPEEPDGTFIVLVLDGVEYRLDQAPHSYELSNSLWNYSWPDTGLLWSEGQKVSVQLIALEPVPPTPPRNVAATGGDRSATLTWSHPVNGGTHTVTKYQYRYAAGGRTPAEDAAWTDVTDSGIDEANRNGFTLTGLTNDVVHTVELRAVSAAGESEAVHVEVIPRSASGAVLEESVAVLGNLDEVTDPTALTIAAVVTYADDDNGNKQATVSTPGYRYAQAFSTGSDGHRYRIDSVEIKFAAKGGGTGVTAPLGDVMHVQLVEWDTTAGRPTRTVGTFEAGQAEAGDTLFRYLGEEYLDADTTYAIRISAAYKDSTSATLAQTASDGEDDGGLDGWDLKPGAYRVDAFAHGNPQWEALPSGNSLQVRIHARKGAGAAGLYVHDAEVYEAHGATLDFKVTLDPAPKSNGQRVTVEYRTQDSSVGHCSREFWVGDGDVGECRTTARAYRDYIPQEGELTFWKGETLKTVSVPVIDDHVEDSGEGVELLLFAPEAKGEADVPPLARDAALGIIHNHEEASEPSEVRVSDARAAEGGELPFVVSLSSPATATVTVDYATSAGTATAGADYTETSGTLTFPAGETSRTVSVPALEDAEAEGDETLTLTLANVVHAVFAGGAASVAATGTIAGDGVAGGGADDSEADQGGTEDGGAEEAGTKEVGTTDSGTDEGGTDNGGWVAAGALTGFALVDAATGLDAGTIANGGSFALPDPANGSWGIRAEAAAGAEIGSVRLELSGAKAHAQTENHPPWSLYGDDGTNVAGAGLPPGAYTLRATAYAEASLSGGELQALEVSFAVAALPPLTATFRNVPDAHDGATAFTFEVLFSEPVPTSYRVLRDDGAFEVDGGTVTRARRVDGRDDLREIHVRPAGEGAVTVTLPPTTDCGARGAVCMDDGRRLSAGDSATVAGPVAAEAVVDGRLLTLWWRSPPDAFAAPDGSDFAVTADGVLRPVSSVSVPRATGCPCCCRRRWVAGQSVAVDHLGSAMHPLRSAAGVCCVPQWRGLPALNATGWSAEERSTAGVPAPCPEPRAGRLGRVAFGQPRRPRSRGRRAGGPGRNDRPAAPRPVGHRPCRPLGAVGPAPPGEPGPVGQRHRGPRAAGRACGTAAAGPSEGTGSRSCGRWADLPNVWRFCCWTATGWLTWER